MKHKRTPNKGRNWALVFVASVLILLGLALMVLAITNTRSFGWWSLLIGVAGLATFSTSTMAIVKNDPTWILLDLIIPY